MNVGHLTHETVYWFLGLWSGGYGTDADMPISIHQSELNLKSVRLIHFIHKSAFLLDNQGLRSVLGNWL